MTFLLLDYAKPHGNETWHRFRNWGAQASRVVSVPTLTEVELASPLRSSPGGRLPARWLLFLTLPR